MRGREPMPWALIVFLLASAMGGIWWGGGLTQRVQAAEEKSREIIIRLDAIQATLNQLYVALVGRPP